MESSYSSLRFFVRRPMPSAARAPLMRAPKPVNEGSAVRAVGSIETGSVDEPEVLAVPPEAVEVLLEEAEAEPVPAVELELDPDPVDREPDALMDGSLEELLLELLLDPLLELLLEPLLVLLLLLEEEPEVLLVVVVVVVLDLVELVEFEPLVRELVEDEDELVMVKVPVLNVTL